MSWLKRHKHAFVETGRQFNPPMVAVQSAQGYMDHSLMLLAIGFTNVTRECECGAIEVEKFLGKLAS